MRAKSNSSPPAQREVQAGAPKTKFLSVELRTRPPSKAETVEVSLAPGWLVGGNKFQVDKPVSLGRRLPATTAMKNNSQENEDASMGAVAEIHKQRFVRLVEHLARLRDVQYDNDLSNSIIERAKKVVALNLPSNLLRGTAIFVDWSYGFPPGGGTFELPAWAKAKVVLPKEQRGSLVCEGLKDLSTLEESEVVVLISDLPVHGLHAGMAGIVRELPSEDDSDDTCLVEFGEPEESLTATVEVSCTLLRLPRPGDLLENYRL